MMRTVKPAFERLKRGREYQPRPAFPLPESGGRNARHGSESSAAVNGVDIPTAPATELEVKRDQLSQEFAELQWQLGGLVYEMAARSNFRFDILQYRAALLQDVDAELGEVERLVRIDRADAGGECDSCGATHGRGAGFCWKCGNQLLISS